MLKGTGLYVEQSPRKSGWRASSGAFEQRRWMGPTAALATFLASGTIGTGYSSIDFDEDGELTTVTVEWSVTAVNGIGDGNEHAQISDLWEMDGNDEEISLWSHPKVTAAIAAQSWTDDQKISFRRLVEDKLAGTASGTLGTTFDAFVSRLGQGTEAFTYPRYVLRHIRTVRIGSDLTVSHTDVEKIYTYVQLTAEETTLASQNLIAASGLTALKWQKRAPTVKPTQDNLWELRQEWWGAKEWDTWIYDAKT